MNRNSATQIVILGGSGDLSRRKLLPALFDLHRKEKLPEPFQVIGLARSTGDFETYADFVSAAIAEHASDEHEHPPEQIGAFCDRTKFVSGSFADNETWEGLRSELNAFDTAHDTRSNRLFYLAVPPKLYGQIFADLKGFDVAVKADGAWAHILVEKPFGSDLKTAQELDAKLAELYEEDQIFRIDHYLAKEAVQNILSFRFANTFLKAAWDKSSVESVHIEMRETIDVGERAGFYEGVGALRDVGQNHLLQLLALTAMREPQDFNTEAIRDERARVLQALRPLDPSKLTESALRAQYEGYKTNQSIPEDSKTETFFELRTELDLPEWRGVPFTIRAGKALDTAQVSVVVNLKDVATGLFETESCTSVGNRIELTISPEQTIHITLNAKSPGLGYQLETRTLSFTCEKGEEEIRNSYEKVLYDSIKGDRTLFTKTDEVLAA